MWASLEAKLGPLKAVLLILDCIASVNITFTPISLILKIFVVVLRQCCPWQSILLNIYKVVFVLHLELCRRPTDTQGLHRVKWIRPQGSGSHTSRMGLLLQEPTCQFRQQVSVWGKQKENHSQALRDRDVLICSVFSPLQPQVKHWQGAINICEVTSEPLAFNFCG